ncbi:MAG: hypothetical protein K8R41_13505 [Bacteroidales bacterium]|nr:hypothetical protein [Bacteroidales bacterium]
MAWLKIFWTSTAIKQRNHIFEYWNERNKSTTFSKKLNKKIKERVKLLKTIMYEGHFGYSTDLTYYINNKAGI